jgi:hypothetical protein
MLVYWMDEILDCLSVILWIGGDIGEVLIDGIGIIKGRTHTGEVMPNIPVSAGIDCLP